MTYKLYNRTGSGGFVVEAALTLAKADFELVDLGSKPGTPLPEEFKSTNPWGQVPTLILPDGSTMTECAAILIHLAACFPEKKLAPLPGTSAHAAFLRWTVFSSVNLYEAILRRGYAFRFTSDPDAIEATRSAANRRAGEAVTVLEGAIEQGPFLLGSSLCVADPYIAMLFLWSRAEVDAPRLNTLAQGVRQHPVVGPVWRRHFGER
ncbi:MAG: glutathione S-transferase family protein [Alphaproteobacteria bacterium]|nr:glutathione S-transferase family protein [Alphaproteobacteria bacterium]